MSVLATDCRFEARIPPWLAFAAASLLAASLTFAPARADDTAAERPPGEQTQATYSTESLRGKVVWLAEALERLHGIKTDADAAQAYCALETADGRLYPLVKDARGRGFWLDERIRDIPVELLVRRFDTAPVVQVIRVYTLKDDGKYELDYWCDICAIPMFELKVCECCQGPIRIREQKVAPPFDTDPAVGAKAE